MKRNVAMIIMKAGHDLAKCSKAGAPHIFWIGIALATFPISTSVFLCWVVQKLYVASTLAMVCQKNGTRTSLLCHHVPYCHLLPFGVSLNNLCPVRTGLKWGHLLISTAFKYLPEAPSRPLAHRDLKKGSMWLAWPANKKTCLPTRLGHPPDVLLRHEEIILPSGNLI